MLSIALLGALALMCVPDSEATNISAISVTAPADSDLSLPLEIEAVREANAINSGYFNPAETGAPAPIETADPLHVLTMSQADPNL